MMADAPGQEAEQPACRRVNLAHSLCLRPAAVFDGALPAIIIFFALLQLFTQRRISLQGSSLSAPPPRIHLKRVFRE